MVIDALILGDVMAGNPAVPASSYPAHELRDAYIVNVISNQTGLTMYYSEQRQRITVAIVAPRGRRR